MKFIKTTLSAAILVAAGLAAAAAQAETIKAVTADNLSPFSRGADKAMPGFNHELVVEIGKRAGVDIQIEYLPWKRAQKVAKDTPNTLVFGLGRNEKRENNYDWITNLLNVERVFLTTGAPVNSFDEASGLSKVAARSLYYRMLDGQGFTNIEDGQTIANFKKLEAGRVDAVFTVNARAQFTWTQDLGFAADQLTIGESLGRVEIWLAASKGFPADTAKKLHDALQELRADGTYEALHKKYFGELPVS